MHTLLVPRFLISVRTLAHGVDRTVRDPQKWLAFYCRKRHNGHMEAGVRELRDHLSRYLDAVRDGEEVTVTDHGKAVARLVPLDRPRVLDQLIAEGLVTPARSPKRPRHGAAVMDPAGTASDLVAEQRR